MNCLAEDTMTALVEGRLPAGVAVQAMAHMDGCPDCWHFMTSAARLVHSAAATPAAGEPAEDAASPQATLLRGTAVGRYIILYELGRGGMGVVYAAYDPELDRQVALKLLRPELTLDGGAMQSRLRREAQVMARLSHPHVVTIYDVGQHGPQLFIAMALIQGQTVTAWLTARPRTAREVLAIFRLAGLGLSAAHGAGIIHRDVKPHNLLVGEAGGVWVSDFGLARTLSVPVAASGARPGAVPPAASDAAASSLSLAGTPLYMAPERYLGLAIDARSDQYSFCVALYQALYGEQPFAGDSLGEMTAAICTGQLREPPHKTRVPAWVRKVLLRGMSVDKEARYESMDALLVALGHSPYATPSRVAAVATGVLLIGGLFAGAYHLSRGPSQLCRGAERQLAGIWDEPRRQQVHTAFSRSRAPYAAPMWVAVERTLSRYADDLRGMYTQACEATHLRGEQSAELLDLRLTCLDRRRRELAELSDQLLQPDDELLAGALRAAGELGRIADCADRELLRLKMRLPATPTIRVRATELAARIAKANALRSAGRYALAQTLGEKNLQEAAALHYPPLHAEALWAVARLEDTLTQLPAAERHLYEALWQAEEGRHDALVADVWIDLVRVVGYRQARSAEGLQLSRHASAAIARSGGSPLARARLSLPVGSIYRDTGELERALAQHQAALTGLAQQLGAQHLEVAAAHSQLAFDLRQMNRLDESAAHDRQALAIYQAAYGAVHPSVADVLGHLGILALYQKRPAEALVYYQQVVAIFEQTGTASGRNLSVALSGLGQAEGRLGHCSDALRHLQKATAIAEDLLGPEHPEVVGLLIEQAGALRCRGDYAQAQAVHERGLAIAEKTMGPEHRSVAIVRYGLADLLVDGKRDLRRARQLAQAARASLSRGKSAPDGKLVAEIDGFMAKQGWH